MNVEEIDKAIKLLTTSDGFTIVYNMIDKFTFNKVINSILFDKDFLSFNDEAEYFHILAAVCYSPRIIFTIEQKDINMAILAYHFSGYNKDLESMAYYNFKKEEIHRGLNKLKVLGILEQIQNQ